ncbi:phage tail sheath C-terminal domain-containing protein [Escherichia sp. E1130]|uniref:phage tail sheath family protein n=1 Tax=Escherichia sp. E1130 TaxID=2041645 RepID=UPI0010816C13|nr:phage tail sheath C-terminal domain-containing protein [Escherichia sp. E1130]TGC20666.1 phage tail protein [Escherichia sp. E1130]TLI63317.1 phage tail sheath family protein [Escherichia sp. E1130]
MSLSVTYKHSINYNGNAPGVIIEYLFSNSLSITSSSTAVPAFATPVVFFGNTAAPPSSVSLSDWMALTEMYEALDDESKSSTKTFYLAMRSYFLNGGGRCYLLKADSGLTAGLARLDDVTLFVQAGQELKDVADLATKLDALKIFAILDGPENGLEENAIFPAITNSPDAAAYYPWLKTLDEDIKIAPSPAVAGVYCSNDAQYGPWWTPANVSLKGVKPAEQVSDIEQAENISSLNMIRNLYKRPALVWGGRTQDITDDWKYVSVKRLFNMVERDVRDALRKIVFHPNTPRTWLSARSAVTSYLTDIWKRGGLSGNKAGEAFFVNVGRGVTMSDKDIINGIMVVEIGIAAVRPAEFIVLRFSQIMGE